MITADVDLDWSEVWSRPDPTCPLACGVDMAIDQDGHKLYRAYARCSTPEYDVKYSDVYRACDAADVLVPDSGRLLMTTDRDRLIADAARIRTLMASDERSPEDMRKIAEAMHQTALKNFRAWEASEVERQRQALDDEQALLVFRHWLRGASLLWERGSPEEKKMLGRFIK